MLRAVLGSIDNIITIILSRPGTSIRFARKAGYAAAAEIYNHVMLCMATIQDDQAVDADNHAAWFETRTVAGYPVLMSEEDDIVTGYASFGS